MLLPEIHGSSKVLYIIRNTSVILILRTSAAVESLLVTHGGYTLTHTNWMTECLQSFVTSLLASGDNMGEKETDRQRKRRETDREKRHTERHTHKQTERRETDRQRERKETD